MYDFLTRPSLSQGPLGFIQSLDSSKLSSVPVDSLHRILLLYYRLLWAAPELPEYFGWSLQPLEMLLRPPHPDPGVRYLAIRCYALHTCMAEQEREDLSAELLGEHAKVDAPVQYGEQVSAADGETVEVKWIDGWLLPFLEVTRVQDYRQSLVQPVPYYQNTGSDQAPLKDEDLSPRIVNVSGVLLVRRTTAPIAPSRLVETPGTTAVLRLSTLQLSRRLPTLITAPAGSGKSLIIQHLASLLFDPTDAASQILTIYLSDTSLDPKSLIGSYISSPTRPGNFEWVEGALVRAMRLGKWVVFKDIDKASGEVLGTLLPLIESLRETKGIAARAYFDVHGRGRVQAADSFNLFATRSVAATSSAVDADGSPIYPQPTFLGSQHWYEVRASAPSSEEQHDILAAQFPKLAGERLRALLGVWEFAREAWRKVAKAGASGSGTLREFGMRDLEKWIRRVDGLLPAVSGNDDTRSIKETTPPSLAETFSSLAVREELLLEAKDVFFGSLPSASLAAQSSFVQTLGETLGLTEDRVQWALTGRTPQYETETHPADGSIAALRIGRTRLVSQPSSNSRSSSAPHLAARPFALHKPSLTLLEQLAVAVRHREPVLLVGETGTGKTTTIQHLSSLLNRPLVAINLSNQTESADLLGGYKPLDPRVPAGELQAMFLRLFEGTFSVRKNEAFVGEVRKAVAAAKWKRCVGMWREGCGKAKARFVDRSSGERYVLYIYIR